jgi:hypothetical protein
MRGGGRAGNVRLSCFEEDFVIGLWVRVAAQDQDAAVGGGKVNAEHLNRSKFVQNGAWS